MRYFVPSTRWALPSFPSAILTMTEGEAPRFIATFDRLRYVLRGGVMQIERVENFYTCYELTREPINEPWFIGITQDELLAAGLISHHDIAMQARRELEDRFEAECGAECATMTMDQVLQLEKQWGLFCGVCGHGWGCEHGVLPARKENTR